MVSITKFDGQYEFLSNFYNCNVKYDGIYYPHTESAFQAQKTLNIHIREEFARAMLTPGQAKRAGKGRPFKSLSGEELKIELRSDWEKVKNSIMYEVVRVKFEQNLGLRERLLATGDAQLIEGNHWHDNYWGNCKCEACKNIVGFNQLGKTLMRLRTEFRGEKYTGIWMDNYIGITHRDVAMQILRTPVKPPCNN